MVFNFNPLTEMVSPFLESSTIHGLVYISTAPRKILKLFWILVVIGGFTGACVMIYNSFQSWADSPVKTTIETLPSTKITFPKLKVCPPKNTYTDLNYYFMMTENMTLDNDTRSEFSNYAIEFDYLYDDIMRNMNKLKEKDRYFNWYHGYSKIQMLKIISGEVYYRLETVARSGSISTQYFGEEFDAEKVETGPLEYGVGILPPASVRNNTNVTLHFDVKKVSLKDSLWDALSVEGTNVKTSSSSFNNSQPTGGIIHDGYYVISFERHVPLTDIKKQKLSQMPGFKATWRYSGMEVEPEAKYYSNNTDNLSTIAFVRNIFNDNTQHYFC